MPTRMSFGLFGLGVVSAPADVEVSPATLSEAMEPALMAPAVVPIKVLRDIEFMEDASSATSIREASS